LKLQIVHTSLEREQDPKTRFYVTFNLCIEDFVFLCKKILNVSPKCEIFFSRRVNLGVKTSRFFADLRSEGTFKKWWTKNDNPKKLTVQKSQIIRKHLFGSNLSAMQFLVFQITRRAEKVDKRMVLEYTHGLFIT
jgi:hypothetical protein